MKYHKPLTPTTPLPYTNIWISDMTVFSPIDEIKIVAAKQELINRLQTFWMTTKKVNRDKSWFVSGGCIGSLLREEKVNDIDVYFFSGVDIAPVLELFTKDTSYKNEVEDVSDKYREVLGTNGKLITENAITLKSGVQIITKHYGMPEEIRKTFDFVHCTPYFDSRDQKLYISKKQYDLNMSKTLEWNNASAITPLREQKFTNRGWKYGT